MTRLNDLNLPVVRKGDDSGPVTAAELLDELVSVLTRYLILPRGAATAIALWIVHAHAHDAARISPLLALLSPDRRCGKTTALELIGNLVPRTLTTANITSAALLRAIEQIKPTILIDEADTFLRRDEALRGVLNAGHVRTSAFIIRATSDGGICSHSVWCPKVIAAIGSLPTTLADRAIIVRLSRKQRGEVVERLRLDQTQDLERVANLASRWVIDNIDHLRLADPQVPEVIDDRAADNWRPLLAIAEIAGREWTERAQRAAVLLTSSAADRDDINTLLLADIREIYGQCGRDRLRSTDITAALSKMEHRPWPEWRNGRPITAVQMAGLLARYGIQPDTHRFGDTTAKGYLLAQFADAFARYT